MLHGDNYNHISSIYVIFLPLCHLQITYIIKMRTILQSFEFGKKFKIQTPPPSSQSSLHFDLWIFLMSESDPSPLLVFFIFEWFSKSITWFLNGPLLIQHSLPSPVVLTRAMQEHRSLLKGTCVGLPIRPRFIWAKPPCTLWGHVLFEPKVDEVYK